MATLFRRPGSKFWWMKFNHQGKRYCESTRSEDRAEAEALLANRVRAIAGGVPASAAFCRLTVDQLLDLLLEDYAENDRRTAVEARGRIDLHLRPALGRLPASRVLGQTLAEYVRRRRAEGAANATINRELAYLGKAYRVAARRDLIAYRPNIPHLAEARPRKGFFEPEQLDAICRHLPAPVADLTRFLAETGWRISEALGLRWADVTTNAIRLHDSKNGEPRTFPLHPALRAILDRRREAVTQQNLLRGAIIPWVFTWEDGDKLVDPYHQWHRACAAAGLAGKTPHDLRRTAAREFDRAGIRRQVAMQLLGHKTPSIYARYNIVSENDLADAVEKLTSRTSKS